MKEAVINWNGFLNDLEHQVLSAQISNQVLALIVVQIRHLPIYNFRLGFQGGEAIIAEMLARLGKSMKRALCIERIAPDRFAVVVPQIGVPELLAISARKLLADLAEPFMVGREIVSVTAAIGISQYPDHGATAEALMSEVEWSLHSTIGDATAFHITTKTHSDQQLMLMQMGADLHTAIADESLSLYYQPKLDLKTLAPVASEALMRWTLPDGTRITPDQFIPVAEASGSIHKLTQWAINTALREGVEVNFPDRDYSVAVNVSASSIYDPGLVTIVESALAIWDLPPQLFTLEVTESMLIKNPELCFRHLSRIREMGVKIAIDDFGTGFSSLSYFKTIPADEIKIDQSFIKAMADNDDDEKIVGSIIDLAHKFGLQVVAEGIQSAPVLHKLQALGCDIGQGYYLAKPMVLEDYQRWLKGVEKAPGGRG